ncbi:MAG: lolA [Gemmatimonadetes bacterium]|nr:lolA [Gemmatimonadota bacterium]
MTRLTNRSLAVLAALALPACAAPTPDAHRDVTPALVQRSAAAPVQQPAAETPAAAVAPAASQSGAHGPNADASDDGRTSTDAAAPSSVASNVTAVAVSPASAETRPVTIDDPQQSRATQILRRVEQTAAGIRTMQADFTQRLDVALLNQHQQSSGRLYQKRPDRFLMRFTDPAGDVMVADGRYFWIYYPSSDRKQVIRSSIARGAGQVDLQRQFLGNATARFNAVLGADDVVGGRPAWVMTLTPRAASQFKRLKVWVDKGDYLVRRFEITEQNDSQRRIELRHLRINAPVADALFRFTPPAGTQVFDQ